MREKRTSMIELKTRFSGGKNEKLKTAKSSLKDGFS